MKLLFLHILYYLIPTLALITFSKNEINAQTTLSAGDMAIVGYNYDNSPQQIAIVTLVDLQAGTKIYISDYGYDEATLTFGTNSVANSTEGAITWTTTSSITKGTLFLVNITSGTTPSVSGLPGSVSISGWTNTLATSSPSAAGGTTGSFTRVLPPLRFQHLYFYGAMQPLLLLIVLQYQRASLYLQEQEPNPITRLHIFRQALA